MTTLPFWQTVVMVMAIALATILPRSLPFFIFPPGRPTPKGVVYLGRVLPFAITPMLIVYCLKDTPVLRFPYALPESIAVAVVAGLYLKWKNSLVAIAGGTIFYMALVQLIFTA